MGSTFVRSWKGGKLEADWTASWELVCNTFERKHVCSIRAIHYFCTKGTCRAGAWKYDSANRWEISNVRINFGKSEARFDYHYNRETYQCFVSAQPNGTAAKVQCVCNKNGVLLEIRNTEERLFTLPYPLSP